jgi:hypothetical protein
VGLPGGDASGEEGGGGDGRMWREGEPLGAGADVPPGGSANGAQPKGPSAVLEWPLSDWICHQPRSSWEHAAGEAG